ncbi:hypothetical protein KKF61_02180, partial [Patescibacteria group bacterium]|nr:hypothetical protein [Patescibacteria group bacterium]
MTKKYPKWIDEYANSVHRLFKNMDFRTLQPLNCFQLHPLYSDLWIRFLFLAIRRLKEKKLAFNKAVEVFPNPTSIRAIIKFLIPHYYNTVLDHKDVDPKKVREVFNFLIKVLKAKNHRDIFAYQENICHTKSEILNIINKIEWYEGNPMMARALGQL